MGPLAELWHTTWHEAHAAIVPAELTAERTLTSFAQRLSGAGDRLRVAGPRGAPLGLCIIKEHRIDQIYVASAARGTGLARALLCDGEARLAGAGISMAEVDCAEQNARAAAFYVANGWLRRGIGMAPVETSGGEMLLRVIIFGKRLDIDQLLRGAWAKIDSRPAADSVRQPWPCANEAEMPQ